MDEEQVIVLYGTSWCGGTRVARKVLDENQIPYRWVDIDQDMDARKYVEDVNNGFRSVPTLIFPDGSKLVEPTSHELREKLGLEPLAPAGGSFF